MEIGPTELRYNAALGARIQKIRKQRDYTQKTMAEAMDVLESRYSKWENRSPMPPYRIVQFALIHGISVEYILTGNLSARRGASPPLTVQA